jgi:hypothetical protein
MGFGFGSWGRLKYRGGLAFHEKVYRRRGLAEWDARWHGLSPLARSYFLNVAKFPRQDRSDRSEPPRVPTEQIQPAELKELFRARYVDVYRATQPQDPTDRAIIRPEVSDFAARVRMLHRRHLLDEGLPSEFGKYVEQAFFVPDLMDVISGVLHTIGFREFLRFDTALQHVMNYRWPAWVARTLDDPLAEQILEVFWEAGGPILLVDLPGRLHGSDPDRVRAVADELVAHLALVEDLQPGTFDILIGFLPAVLEGIIRAARPRERPPLAACEHPKEVGPDASPIVDDLRAFLLEVTSQPPRLRQDLDLYQKEHERFGAALDPLPSWLMAALKWSDEGRLGQALAWARTLGLVANIAEGSQVRLRLTAEGQRWLSSRLDAQYAAVYGVVNALPTRDSRPSQSWRIFHIGPDGYYSGSLNDTRFFGEQILVRSEDRERRSLDDWQTRPEDLQALRAELERAFAALEPGVSYRLDSIGPHLAFGEHNPLNLGLAPERVTVTRDQQPVPAFEELREEAGRALIVSFILRRLIPLGCVRTAIDAEGRLCVARGRRLDAYFGHEVDRADLAPAADAAARVVVQPDFSVIVIGPNPSAVAELLPFCERTKGGGGQGAMILKITRESVIRAAGNGLHPAEVAGRLRRHASIEVPANVLHEVREWSNWVRRVTPATLAVLRCPDRDAADRVMSALRNRAERLNDTLVALDRELTPAERGKLRAQGIFVQGDTEDPAGRIKGKKKEEPW